MTINAVSLVLFGLSFGCLSNCRDNTRLKVVLTKEGLELVANEMLEILSTEASNLKFDGFSSSTRAVGGTVDFAVRDFQIIELPRPNLKVHLKEGQTLTASLSDVTVKLISGWSVAYEKGIIRFKDTGRGEVIVNATGLDLELTLSVDDRGRLEMRAVSCLPRLGNVLYKLEGDAWFYDTVIQLVRKKIRSSIEKGMCDGVVEGINKDLANLLSVVSFESVIDEDLVLNLSLTSAPVIGKDKIEVSLDSGFKGDSANDTRVSMETDSSSMAGLYVSEDLFNSAARVLFSKRRLKFVHTTPTILNFLVPLNITTASTGSDSHFSFSISATSAPTMSITPENITLKVDLIGSIALKLDQNFTYDILKMLLSLQCQLRISVDNGQLTGTLGEVLSLTNSTLIPEEGMEFVRRSLVQSTRTILSAISTSAGNLILATCGRCVRFADTVVELRKGFLVLATNLIKR